MPDTFTTNLNLTKPEVGASRDSWGVKWNSNADALDTAIGNRALRATEIGATAGLEGGGSLAANRTIGIADAGVTTAKIADGAVTNAKLAGGSIPAILGYTPANKAGDTFTSRVQINYAASGALQLNTSNNINGIQFLNGTNITGQIGANSTYPFYVQNASSNNVVYADASGNFVAVGNVSAYSDASLKENVQTIHDGLDLVRQMRGVRYTRIGDGKAEVGVIAQEMEPVLPEVIHRGEKLSVCYQNLTAPLIEAVKQLDEIAAKQGRLIEDLTARIKALEAR